MTQLVLDLFGTETRRTEREERRAAFLARHQIGIVRLPYDTQGGQLAGALIPAWVCCHCGTVELDEFSLGINHGCNNYAPYPCRRTKPRWDLTLDPAQ